MKIKFIGWLKSLFKHRGIVYSGKERDFDAADYIQHRLDLFMTEKKPFLQPRYTIKQLSEAIKIPAYQLSAIVNVQKGMNFSDYLNQLRVRYCEELIRTQAGIRINLQELATQSGFQNRNTFTAAFKKFTGRTPSEYLRQYLLP